MTCPSEEHVMPFPVEHSEEQTPAPGNHPAAQISCKAVASEAREQGMKRSTKRMQGTELRRISDLISDDRLELKGTCQK